jgi:hypothetical protein
VGGCSSYFFWGLIGTTLFNYKFISSFHFTTSTLYLENVVFVLMAEYHLRNVNSDNIPPKFQSKGTNKVLAASFNAFKQQYSSL